MPFKSDTFQDIYVGLERRDEERTDKRSGDRQREVLDDMQMI